MPSIDPPGQFDNFFLPTCLVTNEMFLKSLVTAIVVPMFFFYLRVMWIKFWFVSRGKENVLIDGVNVSIIDDTFDGFNYE